MAFRDFIFGQEANVRQAPTQSPQQQQLMSQLLGNLGPQATQAFDFAPIAEAAQNRFQQQTLPSIGERFAGMGAQRGSGYNQAMANAQRDLQTNLAGQQAQFGLQSQSNLNNLLGQKTFENIYEQGTESPLAKILAFMFTGNTGAQGDQGGGQSPMMQMMPMLMKMFGGA